MDSFTLVGILWVCLSVAASVWAIVGFRRGYSSNGVKLPSFVGLSTLKGAFFCGLCVSITCYLQARATGDNMAAIAEVLLAPVLLLVCAVASVFAFGVTKLIPKTSGSVLPATTVPTATLRANISIVVTAVVLTTIVLFTG